MMAVNDSAVQLGSDLVELVAEMRHLIGAVFIAGDDLVDRIDDDRRVILLLRPADQLGRQLIHGDRLSSQVPDVDIFQMVGTDAQRCVHIVEAMKAARPVQFEIAVEYIAPSALKRL